MSNTTQKVTIEVKSTGPGKCPDFTAIPTPNEAGVTIDQISKRINVPAGKEVELDFSYAGSLDGFKFGSSMEDLSSPVGQQWETTETVDGFTVTRNGQGTTSVVDAAEKGTWYFQICLDGRWVDPQIYNKGTGTG